MINKDFFKTLTILYVHNNQNIKNDFIETLNELFNKVYICTSANKALDVFKENIQEKSHIDIIISESELNDFDAQELLLKIRQINKNIPFIIFTKTPTVELLLTSLRQDVTGHFIEPINYDEVLVKIQEVCTVKKHEDEIFIYHNELEEYLSLVNKVAIVFIFDDEGNIVYLNEFLKELIKCSDEEILGQNYTIIYHHEMSKDFLNKQWSTLQKGKRWQGKIKYLTKNNSIFYTNSTIIPVLAKNDDELKKFISVNFLTTKEENERREYKKKVLYNLQEAKKIYRVAQQKIDELNLRLEKYKEYDKVEKFLDNQKKQNLENYTKLQGLENKLKAGKNKFEQLTFGVNAKINKISIMTTEMRDFEVKASKKIEKVAEEIKVREAYIERIKSEIKEKKAKVKDLEDVVRHRTEQLVEQKG